MGEDTTFVGLDVHQATVAVAVAEPGRAGEVRFVGEFANEPAALDKLLVRLGRSGRRLRYNHLELRSALEASGHRFRT